MRKMYETEEGKVKKQEQMRKQQERMEVPEKKISTHDKKFLMKFCKQVWLIQQSWTLKHTN